VPEAPVIAEPADDAGAPVESAAAAPHPQDDVNVVVEIPEHKDEAARAVAVESPSAALVIETASAAPAIEADTSAVPAARSEQEPPQVASSPSNRRKCDRRRSEASSASERSAGRALWAERRRADRIVQLKRFGNLEQKFHDRAVVISRRAFRHILLVKESCSARDSVNGTEVAFH
jgi:hypothetical protein